MSANDCIVPENAIVKIYSPVEQQIEIPTNENQEPYVILTPDDEQSWVNKIIENPSGKFKLVNRTFELSYFNLKNINDVNFSGILEGNTSSIIQIPTSPMITSEMNFIFNKIDGATIINLLIIKKTLTNNSELFLAKNCGINENIITNVIRTTYTMQDNIKFDNSMDFVCKVN